VTRAAASPVTLQAGPGTPLLSSAGLGWRLARVELCRDPVQLPEFATPAAPDLSLIMVTAGRYTIESRHVRGWRQAEFGPGSVAVNVPDKSSVFRWHSADQLKLESLHVRFSTAVVHQTLEGFGLARHDIQRLDVLSLDDTYVATSLTAVRQALETGAAGLYADTVAESLLSHLVYTALAVSAKRNRVTADAGLLSDKELQRVFDYMSERMSEEVRLEELAGLVNISKFHFLRTFKEATGLTPHRYLTRLRLHRAAGLLRNSRLSVQQVAAACGYTSPSRFAAAFRQAYGVTPAGYRR
jgi:AraC family transcriptional regulator